MEALAVTRHPLIPLRMQPYSDPRSLNSAIFIPTPRELPSILSLFTHCCFNHSAHRSTFFGFSFISSPNDARVLSAALSAPETGFSMEASECAVQGNAMLVDLSYYFYTLRKEVETNPERVEEIRTAAGLKVLEENLTDLEEAAADISLWDDRAKDHQTLQPFTDVKEKTELLNDFKEHVEETKTIVTLTEEMDSIDTGLLEDAASIVKELRKMLDRFEVTQLLSGPYDKEGAVVTMTAGAGGTVVQCRIGLICFSDVCKVGRKAALQDESREIHGRRSWD